MGLGDKIRGAISDAIGATPVTKALTPNNGHTTSGLDAAMQAHADKVHPLLKRSDGSLILPLDQDYKP